MIASSTKNFPAGAFLGVLALTWIALARARFRPSWPRRVLIYGDSNAWGWIPAAGDAPARRYSDAVRWPGVMARGLGPAVRVDVDGLPGRTTNLDASEWNWPLPGAAMNGTRDIRQAIARSMPLDLVIVMLGTNDLLSETDRSPDEIAEGACALVSEIRAAGSGIKTAYPPPEVLVVVPPPLGDAVPSLHERPPAAAHLKSLQLAPSFQRAFQGGRARVFEAGRVARTTGSDGVHFAPEDHARLGKALGAEVRRLIKQLPARN